VAKDAPFERSSAGPCVEPTVYKLADILDGTQDLPVDVWRNETGSPFTRYELKPGDKGYTAESVVDALIPESWDWSSSGVDFRPFGNGQDLHTDLTPFEKMLFDNAAHECDVAEAECEKYDRSWPADRYTLKPGDKGYTEEPTTFVTTGPDRIAGDDDPAQDIKGEYYDFDRFESKGDGAYSDAEIGVTQPFVHGGGFESGIMFCSMDHLDALKRWQGR